MEKLYINCYGNIGMFEVDLEVIGIEHPVGNERSQLFATLRP